MTRVHVRPTAKTRARRRRRRAITFLVYLFLVFGLAWFFESQGTTTIVFVRHADIDNPAEATTATPLNIRGRTRAEQLASTLANFDVNGSVNAIYVDETLRTQQTAKPLAERIGVEAEVASHANVVDFMKLVRSEHKREIILVVTQKEFIAPLVEELHGSKNLAEIDPIDFDNLYIVVSPWNGKVKTLQLPY